MADNNNQLQRLLEILSQASQQAGASQVGVLNPVPIDQPSGTADIADAVLALRDAGSGTEEPAAPTVSKGLTAEQEKAEEAREALENIKTNAPGGPDLSGLMLAEELSPEEQRRITIQSVADSLGAAGQVFGTLHQGKVPDTVDILQRSRKTREASQAKLRQNRLVNIQTRRQFAIDQLNFQQSEAKAQSDAKSEAAQDELKRARDIAEAPERLEIAREAWAAQAEEANKAAGNQLGLDPRVVDAVDALLPTIVQGSPITDEAIAGELAGRSQFGVSLNTPENQAFIRGRLDEAQRAAERGEIIRGQLAQEKFIDKKILAEIRAKTADRSRDQTRARLRGIQATNIRGELGQIRSDLNTEFSNLRSLNRALLLGLGFSEGTLDDFPKEGFFGQVLSIFGKSDEELIHEVKQQLGKEQARRAERIATLIRKENNLERTIEQVDKDLQSDIDALGVTDDTTSDIDSIESMIDFLMQSGKFKTREEARAVIEAAISGTAASPADDFENPPDDNDVVDPSNPASLLG